MISRCYKEQSYYCEEKKIKIRDLSFLEGSFAATPYKGQVTIENVCSIIIECVRKKEWRKIRRRSMIFFVVPSSPLFSNTVMIR